MSSNREKGKARKKKKERKLHVSVMTEKRLVSPGV